MPTVLANRRDADNVILATLDDVKRALLPYLEEEKTRIREEIIRENNIREALKEQAQEDLLTVQEVADILRISKTTLWSIRKNDDVLKSVTVGGKMMFKRSTVRDYIDSLPEEAARKTATRQQIKSK